MEGTGPLSVVLSEELRKKSSSHSNSLRSLDAGMSHTSFRLSVEDYQVFCGFHRLCL